MEAATDVSGEIDISEDYKAEGWRTFHEDTRSRRLYFSLGGQLPDRNMLQVKKNAPPELVDAIRGIEERADGCFEPLALLKLHSNTAIWSILGGGIKVIEREIAAWGDDHPHFSAALLNLSRLLPVAIKWAAEQGMPPSRLVTRRWTAGIEATADEAISVAHNYCAFLICLPMWHKHRYAAELISPTVVRFTASGTERDRQVSAQQKGFGPKEGNYKRQRGKKPDQTPRMQELFTRVFHECKKTGSLRFAYDDPWDLWLELLSEYQGRVNAIVRRSDSLSLGDYTLGEFKQVYAALLAICAAHEFLCFAWERNYKSYPHDSGVLIRSQSGWADVLARLSGISREKCRSTVRDLTFNLSRSLDLHIHPFVPLDQSTMNLALAPQFPLHSRPDENILRVCSTSRPDVFDMTSLEKEPEMLATLCRTCTRYSPRGPIPLPKPLPDIDLIVADEGCSTVVIAELKWIRKTTRPVETMDRDADVLKGIGQLQRIQRFLTENPDHLKSQGKLPKPLGEYRHVHYLLVARDHWLWLEPADSIAIIDFEAFSAAIERSENLLSAVNDLLKYEWLPVDGRDFRVQYDRATPNGVSIECEVFYPT